MRIVAAEYDLMRSCFAVLCGELFPGATGETDPVVALDRSAAKSAGRARDGLAMAIGDFVEMTADWPPEKVAALDVRLEGMGLPSLSMIRIRFSQTVARALRRGRIKDEAEYGAVRNAAEIVPQEHDRLWALLGAYEQQVTG